MIAFLLAAAAAASAAPIPPGPGAQERLQSALIAARPGETVELGEGTFELTLPLSLDADRVTVKGKGMGRTVLSFKGQEAGAEGFLVTSHGAVLEDFTVLDTKGDGVKAKGCKGLTLRRVEASWSAGPRTENGGYGLYPVQCEDVLIEGCRASHASDSGIYVGQSRRVVIRDSRAERNVAGIEVENSREVDVHRNTAAGNTGGILVFDLPDLPMQGGGRIRVFDNVVEENNHPNFAPAGNIVATVPRGTGLLVMANREVEVFRNRVSSHSTANLIVASFFATGRPLKDERYRPFPERIHIHHNRFGPGGGDPSGELGALAAGLAGRPLPAIVWDGARAPGGGERPLSIHDNEGEGFVDLDLLTALGGKAPPRVSRELALHAGSLRALKPVRLR